LKKLIVFVIGLLGTFALAGFLVVKYVQPVKPLDLSYANLSMADKVLDMVKSRKFEVLLTEEDLNNLIKKSLSTRTRLPHDVEITGAEVHQKGSELVADVNLLWKERIPVGATLYFSLDWKEPDVLVTHEKTQIRDVTVPAGWLQLPDIRIRLNEALPKMIGIENVTFADDGIHIALKLK
jgi:hypothetical protein